MDIFLCVFFWGLFKIFKHVILKMWLRFTPFRRQNCLPREKCMGYIHCCGALHKTRTFCLAPQDKFLLCEVDYLVRCPICGHTVVQLTRIDEADNISVIRKINKKAKDFFYKLKSHILYEIKPIKYNKINTGKFYLNYNEFGVKKRCYSNLSSLKIGIAENK